MGLREIEKRQAARSSRVICDRVPQYASGLAQVFGSRHEIELRMKYSRNAKVDRSPQTKVHLLLFQVSHVLKVIAGNLIPVKSFALAATLDLVVPSPLCENELQLCRCPEMSGGSQDPIIG
jgi:hypothetical protein